MSILDFNQILNYVTPAIIEQLPQTYIKETALHIAVEEKHINIVKTLVRAGANRFIKNHNGKSAIDLTHDQNIIDLFN